LALAGSGSCSSKICELALFESENDASKWLSESLLHNLCQFILYCGNSTY